MRSARRRASEFTLFGQVYDLDGGSRMGVVQKAVPAELLDAGRSPGPLSDAGLLSGLRIFQARLAGDDDGRHRFRRRGSIWIFCRGACPIPGACARIRDATAS